jgi:predicted kinase
LHLRNICLIDGRPTLFDAIEFSDRVACIDVLYDFAFLLMDLEHRGFRPLANLAFNRYLGHTGDLEGLAALPLFLSVRAAVRAHVDAANAVRQSDAKLAETETAAARHYLDMALALLDPPPARLVAIGGLSGTGKSSLARALAPELGGVPGAVILRSDLLRKELMGVSPTDRLGDDAYTPEVTKRVFDTLSTRAAIACWAGHAVIADAVFGRPAQRAEIERVAREAGVAFTGLWLEAPAGVLEQRVAARVGDASDATVAVVRRQLGHDVGTVAWNPVDASGGQRATLDRAQNSLADL